MTLIQQKPSLDELAHHGVKGMRWGQRKKVTTAQIHDARFRQHTRENDFINARGASTDPNKSAKARASAKIKADKAERDFNTNEDRITSHRLTRGEKALFALGIVLSGPAAPAVAVGVVGGKSIANHIVKKSVAKARAQA